MKNRIWLYILIIVIAGSLQHICCVSELAGGSSGTEVSAHAITGAVVDSNGNPVENALVRLRPSNFLVDTSGHSDIEIKGTIEDALTDKSGSFRFDSVNVERYYIEINFKDSVAVLLSCTITEKDTTIHLLRDTLKAMGVISGNIQIEDDDPGMAVVQVYGLQRLVHVDSANNFTINVPLGIHEISISVHPRKDSNYKSEFDKVKVQVQLGQNNRNKNIGSIHLQRKQLPGCADYSCDSTVIDDIIKEEKLSGVTVNSISSQRGGRIVELSLRGFGFEILPEKICKLKALEVLDVGKNKLNTPLYIVNKMERLAVLKADSNSLTEVSGNLAVLPRLRYLNLNHNFLNTIPGSFCLLAPDSSLDLSFNSLCSSGVSVRNWMTKYDPDWIDSQDCSKNR